MVSFFLPFQCEERPNAACHFAARRRRHRPARGANQAVREKPDLTPETCQRSHESPARRVSSPPANPGDAVRSDMPGARPPPPTPAGLGICRAASPSVAQPDGILRESREGRVEGVRGQRSGTSCRGRSLDEAGGDRGRGVYFRFFFFSASLRVLFLCRPVATHAAAAKQSSRIFVLFTAALAQCSRWAQSTNVLDQQDVRERRGREKKKT